MRESTESLIAPFWMIPDVVAGVALREDDLSAPILHDLSCRARRFEIGLHIEPAPCLRFDGSRLGFHDRGRSIQLPYAPSSAIGSKGGETCVKLRRYGRAKQVSKPREVEHRAVPMCTPARL